MTQQSLEKHHKMDVKSQRTENLCVLAAQLDVCNDTQKEMMTMESSMCRKEYFKETICKAVNDKLARCSGSNERDFWQQQCQEWEKVWL